MSIQSQLKMCAADGVRKHDEQEKWLLKIDGRWESGNDSYILCYAYGEFSDQKNFSYFKWIPLKAVPNMSDFFNILVKNN